MKATGTQRNVFAPAYGERNVRRRSYYRHRRNPLVFFNARGWVVIFAMAISLFLLILSGVSHAGLRPGCEARGIPSKYDFEIRTAARRYLPYPYGSNWCFLKAQFWVESRLNPSAVSPRGARGIAQIMPGTEREIRSRLKIAGTARNVRAGIRMGAGYMARMFHTWRAPRSSECRMELAWASYNAGAGSIIRAQTVSGGRRCWKGIGPYLRNVTGGHAVETLGYVSRIWGALGRLMGTSIR